MIDQLGDALLASSRPLRVIFGEALKLLPLAVLCGLAQFFAPATRRRPKIRSYEFWLDVLYAFQSPLLAITALGAGRMLATRWLVERTPGLQPLEGLPFAIEVLIAVWAFDFLVYWRHRLEHRLPFVWPIHAVHHTSTQVDFLTTKRLHILEWAIGGVLNGFVWTRLGLGFPALSLGFSIYLYYNYYIHTNVRIRYPGFLKYVFVSPFMHRWHHATDVQARDKNFGVVFAWNDWLFRSAYHPAHEPTEFGLLAPPGEQVRESYLAHQLYPFKIAALRLYRWLRPATAPVNPASARTSHSVEPAP